MAQKPDKDHPHAGHRKRLRNEFTNASEIDGLPEHNLLEMLLFYGIPQRDTNELAVQLIDQFGSFAGVFDADVEDLATVKGMTRNAACLIKLVMPVAKAYLESREEGKFDALHTREEIGSYLLTKYLSVKTENLTMLCLNRAGKVLSFSVLAEGDVDSVGISVRSVLEQVMRTSATAVVLAHNHPSGIALPTPADIRMTEMVAAALKTISVNLVDHIIIADGDYVSMAQSSKFRHIFE